MMQSGRRDGSSTAVLGTSVLAIAIVVASCGGPNVTDQTPQPTALPTASSAPSLAAGAAALPTRLFAPYVEMWVGDRVTTLAEASGNKHFTLAFLETTSTTSCELVWNGATRLDDVAGQQIAADARALRAMGGDVIPSFGGYAADHEGREIADSCADVDAIATAYESVIAALDVTRLDMDVEVESLDRPDGIDRRNKALRILQDRLAAQGRTVQVQYTLPTSPQGMEENALAVLRNAIENGAHVDIVNIMVFDYYDGTTTDMGAAAIGAAQGLHGQLATLYPDRTDAQLWAMVGLTIMNGVDDYPEMSEITTVEHAQRILDFALANQLSHLSMWAVQRDNGSCPGGGAGDACSGIEQADWAFTSILGAFTSR